jgi:hypothetical protein
MAREINKAEVGDYDLYGIGPVWQTWKNAISLYGSADTTRPRLTEQDYTSDLQYVRQSVGRISVSVIRHSSACVGGLR